MIVFFDGDCLLCQASLKWLNRIDDHDRLRFAPLGGQTAQKCGIDRSVDSIAVIEHEKVWRSSEAVRVACQRSGGIGIFFSVALSAIPHRIREKGYRLIARNRRKLIRDATCGLPEQGMREKALP